MLSWSQTWPDEQRLTAICWLAAGHRVMHVTPSPPLPLTAANGVKDEGRYPVGSLSGGHSDSVTVFLSSLARDFVRRVFSIELW